MGKGNVNFRPKCDLTLEDRWFLFKKYIETHGLVQQHIRSFNHFVEKRLQEIVNEYGKIETSEPGYYIKLGKIWVEDKPKVKEADGTPIVLTPLDARLRRFTYSAPIWLELIPVVNGVEMKPQKVQIGEMPIMVKSCKCILSKLSSEEEILAYGEDPKDPGGYFIINGSERVIVAQEDLASNKVLVEKGGDTSARYTAKVFSEGGRVRMQIRVELAKDGVIYVSYPQLPEKIPFTIFMKALGFLTDQEICEAVSDDEIIHQELLPSLEKASKIKTREDALDYIGRRLITRTGQPRHIRIQIAERHLDQYFFAHIGTTPDKRREKGYFLAYVVEKLLQVALGRRPPDDKDHYANKRLKLAGEMLELVFRRAFERFMNDLRNEYERHRIRGRKRIKLETFVRPDIIRDELRRALATGNWPNKRTGVSQILDRTNYLSTLSHLRRVNSPLQRGQPHYEARELHPTQWGRLCPNESPEGQNCGLVKNLALMARITIGVNEKEIEKLLFEEFHVIPLPEAIKKHVKGAKIILNGRPIGVHPEPEKLVSRFRALRRKGLISPEVNIAYYKTEYVNEVYVNTDAGRVQRPLIIVENGEVKLKHEHVEKLKRGEWQWDDLLKHGLIEYLDGDEEENAYIALDPEEITPEHTHLELMPVGILGVVAGIIPYADHNQSPRNSYEAAMGKQALGIPAINFKLRMDTRMHLLHYPQKPLVQTRMLELIGYNERPAGQNAIVAVSTWAGYNIEDALIFNKASIERGFGRSTFFRTYETKEIRYPGGESERIEKPSPRVTNWRGEEAYNKLAEDGIVDPEVYVTGGQVLIGKTSPPRFYGQYLFEARTYSRRDTSVELRRAEKGYVDMVLITFDADGNKLVRVRVRDLRIPELGDKFASRHGQKGVIGMIVPQEDLPFTEEGIIPDIMINPHAFPSRMTVSQLIESIGGKVAALAGRFVDGTPFYGEPEDKLREELKELGYRPDGRETMYDGITGEMLKVPITIGIVYYQKLHHMVADKIHARAKGKVQMLTRQPTEGRARHGGLRFGEMERDTLIGHGAAALLKDRLLDQSDKTIIFVCEKCGMIGYHDNKTGRLICPIHGDKYNLYPVEVSYAFKLLIQELMSMCIWPRIILGDKTEEV